MFKEFKPREAPAASRAEICQLFEKGDYHNGMKHCRRAGYALIEFHREIEIGARRLVLGHRPAEVLSFIYKYGLKMQYDVPTLLRATFEVQDFAGFLKEAYRFKIYSGFEHEIEFAIQRLVEKRQIPQAEGWRRKFAELRKQVGEK